MAVSAQVLRRAEGDEPTRDDGVQVGVERVVIVRVGVNVDEPPSVGCCGMGEADPAARSTACQQSLMERSKSELDMELLRKFTKAEGSMPRKQYEVWEDLRSSFRMRYAPMRKAVFVIERRLGPEQHTISRATCGPSRNTAASSSRTNLMMERTSNGPTPSQNVACVKNVSGQTIWNSFSLGIALLYAMKM